MVDRQKPEPAVLGGGGEESAGASTGQQARPPPRRRREQSEASAFLSKTYAMIDALPSHIGGWSDAGDTMVILDSERFASEYIPQYFKHNNFRSFVRQLNFYGFRKLRADAASGTGVNRWEFKHANFQRGHPELLVQIRRAEHYDYTAPDAAAQRQRQNEIERELLDMRQRMDTMQQTIDSLSMLTNDLVESLRKKTELSMTKHSTTTNNFNAETPPALSSPIHTAATVAQPTKHHQTSIDSSGVIGPTPTLRPTSLQIISDLPSFSSLNEGKAMDADLIPDSRTKRAATLLGRSLEGKPLKRLRTGGEERNDNLSINLDGQPLERRLSTFETSRLDSLIRTLGDDEILPVNLLNAPLDTSLTATQPETHIKEESVLRP